MLHKREASSKEKYEENLERGVTERNGKMN